MEKKTPKVDPEKVARLLAIKPASYSDFTEDQARDFLATLYEAGEVEAVRKYYYTTIRRPYLFRTRADRDTIPAEVATEYYYGAIALSVLEDVVEKLKSISNINYFYDQNVGIFAREYNRARAFVEATRKERETLGEEAYKKIVPIRDAEAESLFSATGYVYLISYNKGEGDYKLHIPALITGFKRNIDAIAANSKAYYVVKASAGDVIKALRLEEYAGDFFEVTKKADEAVKGLRAQLVLLLTLLLEDYDKDPGLYTEARPTKKAETALYEALNYDQIDPRKEEDYDFNVYVFGNSTTYLLDKVKALNDGKEGTK